MSTDPGPQRLRASDTEREALAGLLRTAMADGRLTLAEGEDRLGLAYGATYRDELAPLTADLPVDVPRAGADRPGSPWRGRDRRWGRRWGWRLPLPVIAVAVAVLLGLWALSGARPFFPVVPLVFIAFGLLRHARWHRRGYPMGVGSPR
jgi:hypothetical protein